ncbi:MAG: hypothetical protein ACRC0Q_00765 [Kurthia gibsonii]
MFIENEIPLKTQKKKATFELDPLLHKELKKQSVIEERPMVDILEEALKKYLKRGN